MDETPPQFLDPQTLLDSSQPMQRSGWLWYGASGFIFVILMSTLASRNSVETQAAVKALSALAMLGVIVGMGLLTWNVAQRHRAEQQRLEAIDELLQLRRWPEAAMMLQGMLSQPTRTPQGRVQALIYLTSILGRYHRYSDAIAVQNHLLEEVALDPGTDYGLRLGRAMAMLHEDRLVDADRAINELRRIDEKDESAGLALVEIYRDVKTGHPAEAIELFLARRELLRKQLGHRVADVHALIARAYDMVGHEALARQEYLNATLLAPIAEISRRYAEVASLTGKYEPAVAPLE